MKIGSFRLLNILAVVPLTILVSVFVLSIGNIVNIGAEPATIFHPFVMTVMIGYYTVPTIGIPYIIIWGSLIALAWRAPARTKKQKALLITYTFAMFFYAVI